MSFFGDKFATNTTTADAAVKAGPGRLCGFIINPTGAVTPTVTFYNNASAASGVKLAAIKVPSAVPFFVDLGEDGVVASLGIFVNASSWATLDVTTFWK